MHKQFEELSPNWFHRAHVYTGSIGSFGNDFRYRFVPESDAKIIRVAIYTNTCYELATDIEESQFSWDEAGVDELKKWLQEKYEEHFLKQA